MWATYFDQLLRPLKSEDQIITADEIGTTEVVAVINLGPLLGPTKSALTQN